MGENSQQLPALRRGIDVLRTLALNTGWTSFSHIQQALGGVPAPTMSRLLKVLVDEELVERSEDHGRYRRGPALLDLAHLVLGSLPKARMLQPLLDSLADATGQSAALFEFDSDAIVMVAKAERPNSCHFIDVGARNTDLGRHGFARTILAHMREGDGARVAAHAPHPPECGIDALEKIFADIRESGVCIERSESKPNWMRITAPVFGASPDHLPDAIGVTAVDVARETDTSRWAEEVTTTARRATELLQTYYAAHITESEDI